MNNLDLATFVEETPLAAFLCLLVVFAPGGPLNLWAWPCLDFFVYDY